MSARIRQNLMRMASSVTDVADPELVNLADDVKVNFLSLMRVLEDHPEQVSALKSVVAPAPARHTELFVEQMRVLRSLLAGKLATSHAKARSSKALLRRFKNKFHQETLLCANLQAKYRPMKEEYAKELMQKDRKVQWLDTTIHRLRTEANQALVQASTELAEWEEESGPAFNKEQDEMSNLLTKFNSDRKALITEHLEDEEYLLKRKIAKENEIAYIVKQYDEQMIEQYDAHQELLELHTTEKIRLTELQDHFTALDKKRHTEALLKAAKERRDRALACNWRMVHAAARFICTHVRLAPAPSVRQRDVGRKRRRVEKRRRNGAEFNRILFFCVFRGYHGLQIKQMH
eukprot:924785_1